VIPKVSVVLNAYDGDPWIDECIQSILGQTFQDFELIIIDDGSRDGTWGRINAYKDDRIRPFKQENRGIASTANRGVGLARAPYVARIDQDDVMMPTRLEREFAYLEANPNVALICTYALLIYDRTLSTDMYRAPLSSTALALRLVFECPIVQPSVMFRTDVFRELGGYDEDKRIHGADDFDLWTRMAHDHKLICLAEPLTRYRVRPESVSQGNKSIDHNVLISERSLHRYLAGTFTEGECHSLAAIFHRSVKTVPPLELAKALQMFDQVTDVIAGPRQGWDKETAQVYGLQRRMIFFHHILRHRIFHPLIQRIPALRLR
jgi:glycosyltransferase involved in cell wall biosynthesis